MMAMTTTMYRRSENLRHNRGVALVTALLLTALATMMAVSLVSNQHIDIRRTANLVEGDRAYLFALGIEDWVKQVLTRDDLTKDGLDEDWALVLPPIVVEGGQVTGKMEDLQARFNLNNLLDNEAISAPDVAIFRRLLANLGLDMALAEPVLDWLDKDVDARFENGFGAEDDEYMGGEVPYRTSNGPMSSPSELLLVKGFDAKIFQTLQPYIIALPSRTAINVNTASAIIISALNENITMADAEAIITIREDGSFNDINAFIQQDVIKAQNLPAEGLDIKTSYFLLDAFARYGDRGRGKLYSILYRQNGRVDVIMRAQEVY